MGDAAGIGPEIIAKGWRDLLAICRPVVVGDIGRMQWACNLVGARTEVRVTESVEDANGSQREMPCLPGSVQDVNNVVAGRVSAACGRAAYDFLCTATDLALGGRGAGIVTAPLHKEGLRAAGVLQPGHTEILAQRTGTQRYGMILYGDGLAVIHVTLHMALREVFGHLTTAGVLQKVHLLHDLLQQLHGRRARLGVAALNPHAGDGGLFGDEEATIIQPAVRQAQSLGIDVTGPWPADTLFARAAKGEFDGLVAMYHDQGHIALKMRSGLRAVNISAGLPIVRTSVAHGTAYDIAGKGLADAHSLVEAASVAARLATSHEHRQEPIVRSQQPA
jgi:4-hydroxythreonine-4-phosphate dehydrogenase